MKKTANFMLCTLFVAAMFASCGGGSNNGKGVSGNETEKPRVKVAYVESRQVDQIEEFTANVEAENTNSIAPSSPMRIKDILVEVGDYVKKGQKLVQMDEAALIQSRTQLENIKVEFARNDELYKTGGVSKSVWDAQKTSLDVAQTAYDNLLENTELLSPINGVVTARNYDDGDLYSGTPILVVEQIKPVKVKINVSESYFSSVKKGMEAKLKFEVYGEEEFVGKVSLVYPTIDSQTRTFPVEITLNNADGRVRPGMFARVVMSFGVKDHVVVPDQAIVKQVGSGERFVYVYNDGKVSMNRVVLGRRMDTEYELVSGVENGSQVVVAGQSRLNDGMEVELQK